MSSYNPVAHPDATIVLGNVRFSVLLPAVVRIEYDDEHTFDDDPTWAFVNRRFESVPKFNHSTVGSIHMIETSHMRIQYDAASATPGLHSQNLQIRLLVHPHTTWTPGTPNTGNMHGTMRTLDRVGDPVSLSCPPPETYYVYFSHCEEGVVSRDGWVLVDDTFRPRFNTSDPDWTWVRPTYKRAMERSGYNDVYFFAHGHDYMGAMRDFISLSGRIPLMPRYALGPAFSRWFQWNDLENLGIVQSGFAANGIPLDVLVVDMDWHYTYPRGLDNPYGVQVEGWTGHTVYPYLFPEPAHMLAYLQRRGVQVTFNHHPAAGVEFHEEVYPAFARALGQDPSKGATIKFDIANVTFAREYFKHVMKPIDDLGMKYWWLDYQQTPFTSVPFANPTFMCNYAWWTNPYRYGPDAEGGRGVDRPFTMGRFGGLGSHRYNGLGFVGDTYVKWHVLRYETYFMPTASNVAFQWTHDIGGFEGASPPDFFTRHLQFGCFSPALRTHSSKRSPARAIWTYPQPYFGVMRRFYRLRAQLVPYLASAQRHAHESGVPVIRPMYWHYPEADATYYDQGLHQYFFWNDTWMAPIAAAPSNPSAFNLSGVGITPWTVWIPPGTWVEWFSWQSVSTDNEQGMFISRNYGIGEVPLFSRAGSIVALRNLQADRSVLGLASQIPRALTFTVLPIVSFPAGEPSFTSRTRVYDDDGATIAYESGAYYWTDVECTWSRDRTAAKPTDSVRCTVAPPVGNGFPEMPEARSYTWRFIGTLPPATVKVNGEAITRDPYGAPDAWGDDAAWNVDSIQWGYEPTTLSTWVNIGVPQSVRHAVEVELHFAPGVRADAQALTDGNARRLARVISCKEEIDRLYGMVFSSDVETMLNVSAHVSRLAATPDATAAMKMLTSMPKLLRNAVQEMSQWRINEKHRAHHARQRCVAALQDALAVPIALSENDDRVRAAMAVPTYTYKVGEHLTAPEPTAAELAALNADGDMLDYA